MSAQFVQNVDPNKLATPLSPILKSFTAAPFNVAPERKKELEKKIKQLGIRITIDASIDGFAISVDPVGGRITVGLAALERLWAYGYAYAFLFRRYQEVGGGKLIDLTLDKESNDARKLLLWAHSNELNGKHSPWPNELPKPAMEDDDVRAANELFLIMTGFILLHEVAHVELKHRADGSMSSDDWVQQEREADQWAAGWILDEWKQFKDDVRIFMKRSVGITFALAVLSGIELYSPKASFKTHPNTAERLLAFLDKFVPETSENKAEARELAWLVPPTVVQVHLIQSGRKKTSLKPFSTFRDYLLDAKSAFEN